MTFSYLASPYSLAGPMAKETRYLKVLSVLFTLNSQGVVAYSPIAHFHPLAKLYNIPGEASNWTWHNECMVKASSNLIILTIPGWETSIGIKMERSWAEEFDKPIKLIDEFGRMTELK